IYLHDRRVRNGWRQSIRPYTPTSTRFVDVHAHLGRPAVGRTSVKRGEAELSGDTILVLDHPQRPVVGRMFLEPRDSAVDRNGLRVRSDTPRRACGVVN